MHNALKQSPKCETISTGVKTMTENTGTADPSIISRRSLLLGGLSLACLSTQIVHANELDRWKAFAGVGQNLPGEDGYRAWLRYEKVNDAARLAAYRQAIQCINVESESPTGKVVSRELIDALSRLLDMPIEQSPEIRDGSLIVTCKGQPLFEKLSWRGATDQCGPEGFRLLSTVLEGKSVTVIAANEEVGTLYGCYSFLCRLQLQQPISHLRILDRPKTQLRILAHSDNTYPAIDRGYSGNSLWHWDQLPGEINPRLHDYCRLNASIGLNGCIINKVEADPAFIDSKNLPKVAALASIFRPYGIKTYVSINFASPMVLGHLDTADPLDPNVQKWWREKVTEVYALIPDFGGFEVKADSEGLNGPEHYGRSHADGANMLAEVIAPHKGIIMWRAFVYDFEDKNVNQDRVKRAYLQFEPLDGRFASNVLVQVKNGPLDFQPREPFHPLFGGMPKTRLLGELQLNQEYLGQATHLVYLGTMWEEFLNARTYAGANAAPESSGVTIVSDCIQRGPNGIAGGFSATSNLGDDRNWTGHHFGQSNWFVYGRLAWNPDSSTADIAHDWIKLTWSNDASVAGRIHQIMMASYEAYVSYCMPLGLHHMVGGDHYAPMPEGYGDPRGMFHHADQEGIGYDRTRSAAGSDAVDQYHQRLADEFNGAQTCPERFLLWFHHLPWDHRMKSGRTLWDEICFKYESGVRTAKKMEQSWLSLSNVIDKRRHAEVAARLRTQVVDAGHWRDHCLGYFAGINKLAIRNE
jgi:alpha-glucuronidase